MSDVDAIITLEMGDRQGAYQSELERLAHAAGRTVWEQREYHKYLYLSDPTILNHIQRRMEHGEIPSEEIPRLAETTTFEEYLKPQKEVANL